MNKNDCCTKKQDQKIQDITSNSHFSLMYYFACTPIKKPCVNEDFQDLTIVSKVVECLRYNFLYFEYFLSPKGSLRHLFKINIFYLSQCFLYFYLLSL